MPCFTIQKFTVDVGKVNADLLHKAMQSIGITNYSLQGDKVIVQSGRVTQSEIKQAYSRQVVLSQAQRFGWSVKQNGNQFELMRESI